MKTISFYASGLPKGQPRPRAFVRKFGDKVCARVYDAGTAEGWKSQIAAAAKPYLPEQPLVGPTALNVTFNFPRPKNHFRANGTVKPGAPQYHTSRPDVDNCMKAVMDALTQIGLWGNDSQVCEQKAKKLYGGTPGASIHIMELENISA